MDEELKLSTIEPLLSLLLTIHTNLYPSWRAGHRNIEDCRRLHILSLSLRRTHTLRTSEEGVNRERDGKEWTSSV